MLCHLFVVAVPLHVIRMVLLFTITAAKMKPFVLLNNISRQSSERGRCRTSVVWWMTVACSVTALRMQCLYTSTTAIDYLKLKLFTTLTYDVRVVNMSNVRWLLMSYVRL